jgi:hypothetical protein
MAKVLALRGRRMIVVVSIGFGCRSSPPAERPAPAVPRQLAEVAAAPPSSPACPIAPLIKPSDSIASRFRGFGSHRVETADDACGVADNNLTRAEAAILALPPPTPAPASPAWDHRTPLVGLPLITRRFGLDPDEQRHLARDGVVASARLEQPSYAWAYHEIYQSQLPVYISVDSIFNAVYAAHDGLVQQIEEQELAPRLAAVLAALHCQLALSAPRLPADIAHDLDVYLGVARSLLGSPVTSALGDPSVDREAGALVSLTTAAAAMQTVALFGRDRVVDFTQFQPRGHYTQDQAPYFRAVMWLSRLELNLVSRSSRSSAPGQVPDPRETPREDLDALALAQLVTTSAMTGQLEQIERVLTLLAGGREDVPVPMIAELANHAGITDLRAADAADKLRAAIGDRFRRTARIHYMPQGSSELPAITTLLGPRIVPDTVAMRSLMNSETRDRDIIRSGDLAYLAGNDRGLVYLAPDLAQFPGLRANLDKARAAVAAAPRRGDLYTAWLDAIRALSRPVEGALPSFTRSEAFADLRYNTTIAAYAQLRHNYVLIAGEPYGEGGCEIPDGYVEPAPEVYDALARYAELGARELGPLSRSAATRDYFARLGNVARVLAKISRIELAGQPLPAEAQRFLGMVSEIGPFGSDGRPTYTGWYFDLFLDREDAIGRPDLVADYATSPSGVGYVGVQLPVLAIFAVDTGGGQRAMIGPVARAYETWRTGPRLDDETAADLPAKARSAPWTASYTAAAPARPAFGAGVDWDDNGRRFLTIKARRALGAMTIELLDHHRVATRKLTRTIRAGTTRFPLDGDLKMLHLQIGRWHGWAELHCMDGCGLGGLETDQEMRAARAKARAAAAHDPD